jgi:hypothetical protein
MGFKELDCGDKGRTKLRSVSSGDFGTHNAETREMFYHVIFSVNDNIYILPL